MPSEKATSEPAPDPRPGPTGTPAVTHDVDAGARVEFEVQWVPTDQRHHCVQARIDRYVRIPGGVDEPDVDNNLAQSNYFDLISQPKSPATRELSVVDVHNPFPYPADAWIELVQDSTRYRSYVDHRWLHLQPGETTEARWVSKAGLEALVASGEVAQPDVRRLRQLLDDRPHPDGGPYIPHLTLGLYSGAHPCGLVLQRLLSLPWPAVRLRVDRLDLVDYASNVIGGHLSTKNTFLLG